jgi:hypothetical protein
MLAAKLIILELGCRRHTKSRRARPLIDQRTRASTITTMITKYFYVSTMVKTQNQYANSAIIEAPIVQLVLPSKQ